MRGAFVPLILMFLAAWPAARAATPKKPQKGALDVAAARAELLGADADKAAAAAARLGQADKAALPAARAALVEALATGVAPSVAVAVLDALAAKGDATAIEPLLMWANHRDAGVRARAVAALGQVAPEDKRTTLALREALGDGNKDVRAVAARALGARRDLGAVPALLTLLEKGDEAAAPALAALANMDVARQVAERVGKAPEARVADCLGAMLLRKDLGPDDAYVAVVRTLGNLKGDAAAAALAQFLAAPATPATRAARKEAQALVGGVR